MLLAAGRGERMRPLTDRTPKPLLQVQGQSLLHWRLQALLRDGVKRVVINTAWLGEQIESSLGDVFANGDAALQLRYSHEGQDFGRALETAGGVVRALDQLGAVFWVMAADVFAPDFVFRTPEIAAFANSRNLAHLWLVPNPPHHPRGDFGWDPVSTLALNLTPDAPQARYTYSSIGLFRQALFQAPWCQLPAGNPHGEALALAPLLRKAMDQSLVSASLYTGAWTDVGTPARLATLNTPVVPSGHTTT